MITFTDMKRAYILELIVQSEGAITHMVKTSKLSRATVYNMIRKLGLEQDLVLARLAKSKQMRRSGEDSSEGIQ